MTGKPDFTEGEWTRIKRAPFVAGLAITLADPGGPIEAYKETAAILRTVLGAAQSQERGAFVHAIAREAAEDARGHDNPLAGFRPRGAMAGQEILDEMRAANAAVTAKATPDEAAAYRRWLLDAANEAAQAAKDGGFLGFRAERVSEGEQRMLDALAEVLG